MSMLYTVIEVKSMVGFGDKLKDLRKERGFSQQELADRIGIHKNAVCNYELEKRIPTADVIEAIAVLFNVSADYLLGLDRPRMLPIDGLTTKQEMILTTLAIEFRSDAVKRTKKLTPRQQEIMNDILGEFTTEKDVRK